MKHFIKYIVKKYLELTGLDKHKIYKPTFAHRGFHLFYPENTIEAYISASEQNFAIELDVRFLKCGTIVCFHDRYMKRLLNIPGCINKRTFKEIKKYNILGTKCKIPKLEDVLRVIDGKVPLLIETKGFMNKAYQAELEKLLSNYNGIVYFHATNILTYLKLKKVWKKNVFNVLNPLRKRFDFLKGKDYKKVSFILNPFKKKFGFVGGEDYKNIVTVPTIDNIIVEAEDSANTVIKKIWSACNQNTTRVNSNHWLINYKGKSNQIQHRGIIDKNLKEHSREAFEECILLDKIIEFDIIKYEGKIICYHEDVITRKMGQAKSISEKVDIKNSLSFSEILSIVDGKVPIIIDIKDYSVFNRKFEDDIMKELSNYKGEFAVQSFNPLVNMYFMKKYGYVVRGQVGHSLNGLKKLRRVVLTVVNFCLFYRGRPDYIVYDLDPNVYLLSKFNNIIGLPVIGYTVTKQEDINAYTNYFDNFIVEGKIDIQEK